MSHWTVVIAIAAIFFFVQVALTVRLSWRARRHERALDELCCDLQDSGDGRYDARFLPPSFAWLRWALDTFADDESPGRSNFSRSDALAELDAQLVGDSQYLLLQRMGVMAPLLGVVLTVVGFFFLQVNDSGEQSLADILMAVAPLVSGVGAGAVLALVNQLLLHAVGVRFESLRSAARAWFDAALWSRLDRETPALARATASLKQFADAVASSAQRHVVGADRIEQSTVALGKAAVQFRDVVKAFGGEMRGMPQTLQELRSATAAAAQALDELVPMGTRAVANLDVSVAAFRSTIDREFTEAARLHRRSGQELADTASRISQSTDALASTSEKLRQAIEDELAELAERVAAGSAALDAMLAECARAAQQSAVAQKTLGQAARELADSSGQLWHTMESDVAPAQRTMRQSAASFGQAADQLSKLLAEAVGPASRELTSLHDTLVGLRQTVQSIEDFSRARPDIDRLTDALARSADISDALASLPERVREVVEQSAGRGLRLANSRALTNWLPGRPK